MVNDLHAVGRSFHATRQEQALRTLVQQGEAREALLRDEIATWKSHREWSDRIVRAYLDEIERRA